MSKSYSISKSGNFKSVSSALSLNNERKCLVQYFVIDVDKQVQILFFCAYVAVHAANAIATVN